MLAYSNVDRSTVVPAAQANFHTMSSGSKTKAMLALPGEMDEVQEPANANPAAPQYMRIIMDGETSRDDDWVFTGAWNEPGLVAMIDKFGVGWDRDGRPRPTAVKKKRQSKKKNIDEQQRAQERFEIQHETTVEPTQSYSRKRPLPLDDSSEVGTPEVQ